ncbi:hypothetical protein [Leyella stercorea]|uniref:hypothetical protein n=1 Tax=Leyella stercorea TaxID=363265 RepID=UPI001F3E1E7C|nr:hypothetical protein [Leyella stercorea]
MTLDATMKTSDIEERFEKIAKMLFESFAIQKGETVYLFKEIEFYFYNKNHRDIITHPRVSKPLCWYINDFGGIDLNFESNIKFENRLNSKGQNVKNILVLQNAFEKTRKQMKVNTLSINALSDNLNFPMFAKLTLKKT